MANTSLKEDALKALKASGLKQNEVYATQDGNIFFEKGLVELHANATRQKVETFKVEDADKKAADATKKKDKEEGNK